jgi:DNA-binding transcriptional ArsR family regulator
MENKLIDQLATLGHEGRLAVFRLLMRRYPDEVPAGEIAAALELRPSTLSDYLAGLRAVGLITQRREATSLRYKADLEGADGMVRGLYQDCCRGRPDLCATAQCSYF